jgi:two-component system sensor histidine kinase VicK
MRFPGQILGMRWWLGLAFASVAAATALAVVAVLNQRSERAFRSYAEAFAVGRSVLAAETLKHDMTPAKLREDAMALTATRGIRLYVVDARGSLLTPAVSRGIEWSDVPGRSEAAAAALGGSRYIEGRPDGSEYVVGLPIRNGEGDALITYSRQQGLRAALGIIRDEYLQAALIALAVGAALGLVIATLIARRLRRLADAAGAIGSGDFAATVSSRFPDEVGSLALSIERMRTQLRDLFVALESDRDRLDTLLDRLDDGVLVVNRQLEVEFANDRGRELLDVTDHLEGGSIRRLAMELFSTGLATHRRLIGDGRTLEVAGIPPSEGADNAIIVVHDESQQEQNEKVQREFSTNAAHELRTPLASIVTAVEMLQTGAKDDPAARDEFLDLIAREADRLTRLTRALLVLARADAGDEPPRKSSVVIAPLLAQVAGALPPRENVRVDVECPPAIAISGDPDLLEQALSSVAANAIQHTDAGSVTIRGRADNGSVVIEVADTGHGIPAAELRRIFDRFYRAGEREGGFGLGLSIAREAVGALGGEIELESEVAVGTTVRITLERAETSA